MRKIIRAEIIKNSGFTLIELLIVVAIVVVLAVLTIPAGLDFLARQSLKMEAETLKSNLKKAQAQAISAKNNSDFGIKFFPNADPPYYVVFQGPSYDEREPTEDEIFYVSKGTIIEIVGGYDEVIFEKNTGLARFR